MCSLGQSFYMDRITFLCWVGTAAKFTLAPLVNEQWRRLRVGRLDPGWEKTALICFIPQVLVQVGISYFLQGLHVIHWHQVAIEIHKLNAYLWDKKPGSHQFTSQPGIL